jgi:hypothetical protein
MLPVLVCLPALAADAPVPEWASRGTIGVPLDDPEDAPLVFSDPAVWKFGKDAKGERFLELAYDTKTYKSTYQPKHRSPVHIAVVRHSPLTDFVLDIQAMSTTPPYGHQDLCLFFGVESPTKYYYVHLAPAPDMNAHNVFIVNDAPRKNLLPPQSKGIEWKKDTWHNLRLIRQATTGKIEVYFDDMTKPVLTAEDKTFQTGFVGFGSFDDTGRFRKVGLHTNKVPPDRKADFFKPLAK